MKKDIKEIEELFNAFDVLAEEAGKVYKDKKVSLEDLPSLINLAVNAKTILDAIDGFDKAIEEAKDLDGSEQLKIVERLFQVAKKYEAARNS